MTAPRAYRGELLSTHLFCSFYALRSVPSSGLKRPPRWRWRQGQQPPLSPQPAPLPRQGSSRPYLPREDTEAETGGAGPALVNKRDSQALSLRVSGRRRETRRLGLDQSVIRPVGVSQERWALLGGLRGRPGRENPG